MRVWKSIVFVVLIAFSSAQAADFSLGAAFSAKTSPYKSHDPYLMVSPFALYDGDHFYLRGATGGVHLFKNETHKLSLGVSYAGLQFDPDDTDDRMMKRLDKRKSTMMGDLSYAVITPIGLGKLKLSRDLLGRSDGYVADASFGVPLIRECFTIMPMAGVEWSSKKQADYYYGISNHEAQRINRPEYDVSANFSPYVKLEAKFQFTERWGAVAGAEVKFLTGDIKNSPMVGRSCVVGGFLGGVFTF